MKIIQFGDMLREIKDKEKDNKHVSILLGNGASMAFGADCNLQKMFSEKKQEIIDNITGISSVVENIIKKEDSFEDLMRILTLLTQVINHDCLQYLSGIDYIKLCKNNDAIEQHIKNDISKINKIFIETIFKKHPEHATLKRDGRLETYATLLGRFAKIFTTNYDLIPYWSIRKLSETSGANFDDGFRKNKEGHLTWQGDFSYTQNVHYLHGNICMYKKDNQIYKLAYDAKQNKSIKKQIMEKIKDGTWEPLCISAGNHKEKLRKIESNKSTNHGLRSLRNTGGALVTYGFSFSDQDNHISQTIAESGINTLRVGVYGDCGTEENDKLIKRANSLRDKKAGLEIKFYAAPKNIEELEQTLNTKETEPTQ